MKNQGIIWIATGSGNDFKRWAYIRPSDQIKEEFKRTLDLMIGVYEDFNITDYRFRLSYRDPQNKDKYFDDDAMWENAQTMLKAAMDELELIILKQKAKQLSMDQN